MRLPDCEALFGWEAIEGAFHVENGIDPAHRLSCQRRAGEMGLLKQVTPSMGPATGIADRARFAALLVEAVEPGIGVGL